MAEIIQFEPKAAMLPVSLDVSDRVSEMMYAFHLLDHAVLKTSFYHFDSRWERGCRTWTVDGEEVEQEDFQDHLTEWLRHRAQRKFSPAATVLPMVSGRTHSG